MYIRTFYDSWSGNHNFAVFSEKQKNTEILNLNFKSRTNFAVYLFRATFMKEHKVFKKV